MKNPSVKVFYLCDPKLNTKCEKTCCQDECRLTTHIEYAAKDSEGHPVIEEVMKDAIECTKEELYL